MNNHGHTTCTVHILVCTYTLLVTGGIYGTCSVRSCIIHKCFWFHSGGALRGIGISQIDLTVWFYHVLCIQCTCGCSTGKKALHNHYNNSASYAGCGITFFQFPGSQARIFLSILLLTIKSTSISTSALVNTFQQQF